MRFALIIALSVALPLSAQASGHDDTFCPGGNEAVTVPAPVDTSAVIEEVLKLKTADGRPAIDPSAALIRDIESVFDTTKVKTKMEQFYRLLYVLQWNFPPALGDSVTLDPAGTRAILMKATVFTDPSVPKSITDVSVERARSSYPRYEVAFDRPLTRLPLNNGEGFYLWRNGKCQHAKALIFRDRFSVTLRENRKGNIVAGYFKGVDLFGDFGNRGIIDVDIEYIELRQVEFFKGTLDGRVTAYVSQEEFRKNDHNPVLRIITRIVPDRSVQPIDW